jgi:hypothetical protein
VALVQVGAWPAGTTVGWTPASLLMVHLSGQSVTVAQVSSVTV